MKFRPGLFFYGFLTAWRETYGFVEDYDCFETILLYRARRLASNPFA